MRDNDADYVTAVFDLPDVRKEDIHVAYQFDRLTITWESRAVSERREVDGTLVRERKERKYARTLPLPPSTQVCFNPSFSTPILNQWDLTDLAVLVRSHSRILGGWPVVSDIPKVPHDAPFTPSITAGIDGPIKASYYHHSSSSASPPAILLEA